MLTAEQTRRHIHYKVDCRELDPLLAERMLAAHYENPSLDYRQLHEIAVHRPLPDVAFHVADPSQWASIAEHGLRVSDPSRSGNWSDMTGVQPVGVYVSDVYEAMQGKYAQSLPCHVWRIEGLHTLGPEWVHDRLNPTCWAVLQSIPARILSLHATLR